MKTYITDYINNYISKDKAAWHMPGHKRHNMNQICPGFFSPEINEIYARDFTEVPGLDDYHNPTGIIKNSEQELSRIYKTMKSYYLVNGSTSGIMAAIYACVCIDGNPVNAKTGAKKKAIIISRNCHKSVFNALNLLGVAPIYVYPTFLLEGKIYGPVKTSIIEEAIRKNSTLDICGCIITSPTYEGVMSDVKAIAELLHKNNIRLIVDEAHGAHLPFVPQLGRSAIYSDADIVIQSLHKTLPALTQTAIIHIPIQSEGENKQNELISLDVALRKYLSVFQSSSPSYIFMQSMEQCVAYCEENKDAFYNYIERINIFREKAKNLKNIHLFESEDVKFDKSRLVFFFEKLTGEKALEILDKEYEIVMEMSGVNYVTAITSVMDEDKDLSRLLDALVDLDERLNDMEAIDIKDIEADILVNTEKGKVPLKKAEGLRIRDYIYVYPPGVPLIAPYEVITKEMINEVIIQKQAGKEIRM